MVKLLEKKVTNIKLFAGRSSGVGSLKLFGKVDLEFSRNLIIKFSLLIVFGDLPFGVRKRVVGNLQKIGMPADPGNIFCSSFFPIPDTELDEIGRVF